MLWSDKYTNSWLENPIGAAPAHWDPPTARLVSKPLVQTVLRTSFLLTNSSRYGIISPKRKPVPSERDSTELIRTKLYPPRVTGHMVPRPRLRSAVGGVTVW